MAYKSWHIGHCSIYGAIRYGNLTIIYDDDCKDHTNEECLSDLHLCDPSEVEEALLYEKSAWKKLEFFLNAKRISQEIAIDAFCANPTPGQP